MKAAFPVPSATPARRLPALLQRVLPNSLAARTVLLVVVVIALAELATFSLVGHFRRANHVQQTVQLVAAQIRFLQSALPGLDATARQRLLAEAASEDGLQLRADGAGVPQHRPQFGFGRRLAERLGQRLEMPVELRHAGPGRMSGLWIGFAAGGERWWLVLPPPRFEPQALPADFWRDLALALAVLLLVAGLFVRGIVRPLARLGEAVAATGGGVPRTVAPAGPREVRRLAEQHNEMVRRLAAADAERREMLAGLTHDLRAPLARLRVRLALLENEAERAGVARDADDMERIVGQCLAFLRSEEVAVAPVAPLMLASALQAEIARHRELGRPVGLEVAPQAAALAVAIAPGSLQRLLDNLIDNAFRHGAPPVDLKLNLAAGGLLELTVADRGPGVAAVDRERALEAFTQIEPARATGGSCGLGLAIVRRLVAGAGGSVELAEATGGGLCVRLRFPVAG